MITLSPAAAEKILDLLREQSVNGAALRVFVRDAGNGTPQYGMAIEPTPAQTDESIETNGVKVVVDEDSLPWVIGSEIDYVDSVLRSGFTIRNPNFMGGGGCGCGGGGGGCACGGHGAAAQGEAPAGACGCGGGGACNCGGH